MSTKIESLELEILSSSKDAKNGLDALSKSLDKLKKSVQGVSGTTDKLGESNKNTSRSFVDLGVKVSVAYKAVRKIWNVLYSCVEKSSDYVENVNLFTVAMGEYADEAHSYAEKVSDIMGIDPGEWMRNQGIFMTLATGFGITGERASVMSEQLTQLGYDLSSFFNMDVADTMQKLQSGISGELEPLRRLGYDLSQAKLEATALSLGIDKTVSSMTQAEKAQLRYYAIMTQVTMSHGDMARTLEQPANQMRIFKAQIEQAARSIGNIFIPAVNAILPYLIAAAEVVRYVANAIAGLVGFEFPEMDYEGLGTVTGSAEDVEDALDDATKSAKKFKSQLLGIDELNVISPNNDTEIEDTLNQFNFELPTYDFISNATKTRISKIVKEMKEWLGITEDIDSWSDLFETRLGRILMATTLIGGAFLLWKVSSTVVSAISTIAGIIGSIKMSSLVNSFLDGFSLILARGGNFIQSIKGGLDSIRYNLTGFQKFATTAVTAVAEFTLIKDAVKDLAMGCEDVSGKILTIGATAGVAATLMYTALGPAGLAIAGVTALAGVIVGFGQAQEEMRERIVNKAFFDGMGISLETLNDKLKLVTDEFSTQNEQIKTWKDKLDSNDEIIEELCLKIETISTTLGTTGTVTEEEIGAIKKQFGLLYESISENMKLSEEMITTALVGALKRATPEIAAQIDLLIGEYQRYVRETSGRAEELKMLIENGYDELVGKQTDDPAYQTIMSNIRDWYAELGYLEGSMSDAGWQWQQTVEQFESGEIDFGEDIESAKTALEEIANTGKTALDDLAVARDAILKEIDESIRYASQYGSLEDVQMLGDVRKAIENDYAAQEEAIKAEINSIFESIQEGMIGKIDSTKADLEKEWDKMNWFERWWNDHDEEGYVRDGLRDLQGHVDTISDAIQGHMENLKTNGSTWADEAMQGIIDKLFESKVTMNDLTGSTTRYSYAMDLEEAIEQTFKELEESGKKSSSAAGTEITNGLSEGITSMVAEVEKACVWIVDRTDLAVRDAAKINSPSKLFAENGGFMMDGLIKGIEDKMIAIKESVSKVISSVLSKSSATSLGFDFGKNLGKAVADGFKSISFPTLKGTLNVSDGGSASLTLNAYANGGFPETGQMFIAREAGTEMVGTIGRRTAVANNDQIVDGIANGVAEANSEQTLLLREQNSLLRALLEKESGVYLDGRSLTNSVEKYQRERGRTLITGGVI